MMKSILLVLNLLWMMPPMASGFLPPLHMMVHPATTAIRATSREQNTYDDRKDDVSVAATTSNREEEVSRRVALVTAAAMAAAGVTTTTTPAAMAATLERIVAKLERENRDQVNTKGAPEKHLPQVSMVDSNSVTVSIPHVMDPDKPHYIEYVWLMDASTSSSKNKNRVVAVQAFQATDPSPPTLIAKNLPSPGQYIPMAFCNLHGLWEGDTISI
jgi:desulfoferrodoxin (superoxide reductase-like protein)